jgi:hypothetical protein
VTGRNVLGCSNPLGLGLLSFAQAAERHNDIVLPIQSNGEGIRLCHPDRSYMIARSANGSMKK